MYKKHLLLLTVTLLCFFSAISQTVIQNGKIVNGRLLYTYSLNVYHREAAEIYDQARKFVGQNNHLFFTTSGKASDVYKTKSGKVIETGEYGNAISVFDDKDYSISVPAVWRYTSDKSGCLGIIMIKGTVTFEAKDGRTRIQFTDMSYANYDFKTGEPSAVEDLEDGKEILCMPSGAIELLYNCKACNESMEGVWLFLFDSFRETVKKYHKQLREYTKESAYEEW